MKKILCCMICLIATFVLICLFWAGHWNDYKKLVSEGSIYKLEQKVFDDAIVVEIILPDQLNDKMRTVYDSESASIIIEKIEYHAGQYEVFFQFIMKKNNEGFVLLSPYTINEEGGFDKMAKSTISYVIGGEVCEREIREHRFQVMENGIHVSYNVFYSTDEMKRASLEPNIEVCFLFDKMIKQNINYE